MNNNTFFNFNQKREKPRRNSFFLKKSEISLEKSLIENHSEFQTKHVWSNAAYKQILVSLDNKSISHRKRSEYFGKDLANTVHGCTLRVGDYIHADYEFHNSRIEDIYFEFCKASKMQKPMHYSSREVQHYAFLASIIIATKNRIYYEVAASSNNDDLYYYDYVANASPAKPPEECVKLLHKKAREILEHYDQYVKGYGIVNKLYATNKYDTKYAWAHIIDQRVKKDKPIVDQYGVILEDFAIRNVRI